jgi:mannose-1-phosphate guanylyltransferase
MDESSGKGNRYAVIMAGGRGERFWPQSRLKRPKQLLPIVGDAPLLAQTVERLRGFLPLEHILVVTNVEQVESVREVCPSLPCDNIIGEPIGRDTAAAVGLSTLLVARRDPEATFAMLPADHVIHDNEGYLRDLETAFAAAEREEALVTLGIRPTHPATGYGYIERGAPCGPEEAPEACFKVVRFKEKPDAATAAAYLEQGNFLWNAGMFVWRVPVISHEFARHTPELWTALDAIKVGLEKGQALDDLLRAHYPTLPKISIDFAVMEKAAEVRVVPGSFDWDDVGEWPAVARHFTPDAAGNVQRGDTLIEDGRNNIVINEGGHLTAILGCENLIVVQTPDATLVCPKDRAQEIKALVKKIGQKEAWAHLV